MPALHRTAWFLLIVFAVPAASGQDQPAATHPVLPVATAPTRPYDLVVTVSFDGMRADALARADAPFLRALQREGATALDAETIHNSSTLPSHASMLSGYEPSAHGMDFDDFHAERGFLRVPTVFTAVHDAGLATAMFVSKTKLRHIAVPGSLDVWSLPHWSCERVSAAAASYLATAPAGFTFVHFSEPDDAGHMHRWMSARYLAAIHRADACFGALVTALRARPDHDRVLIIATADHGGHRRGHGTLDPHDLHIPWIAWGSHVARGAFREPVHTVDTAATALAALGLAVPDGMTGRPVQRALGPAH